jgi:glycosyltransferase involved in cell wall biosynthesis
VGHVKEERNIQWLAHLQKQQGIQTLLVGSTSTHTEKVLVARLEQCGVRVVTDYMDIVEAYHLADGYLFPTRNEMAAIGIPLSVLEAMACNLAVLATPFGGLPTFFPARPDQGLFYADTPASFATQIPDLLTVQPRTREMVLPFQWTHIARRILVVTQQELAMDWGL